MSLADLQWCPTSVQVTVLQARGLRAKGRGGTNDAYAVMQVGKEKYQTSVVEKSVAPAWREEAAFDLPPLLLLPQGAGGAGGGGGGGGGGERGTLRVHVLHRALVGPDKQLGQAVINLLQLSEDKARSKSEWFKLLDKTGKADKDRGEVLLDVQFMRNNMTASMFDLSAAGKSRSRLGKFKDKVRGKKKESDAGALQSFTQVLTDSEGEANGDEEVAAGTDEKKKKPKMKSLFSSKSNLQRNMSQSMSVLPAKNSSLTGSQSSGLNMDFSEGKKKFKFKIHKRSGSSGGKDSSSGQQKHGAAEQSNLCINGSHVYCEDPQARSSRVGSNFSLASSGHGSMEDVPESSPPSVETLQAGRQYSAWTEEEEEEETAEVEHLTEDTEEHRKDEEEITRMEEERLRKQEEALERLAEEKRRQEEERRTEEKVRREEEERLRKQKEALERLAEEKRRQEEEEERRRTEEKIRREEEERLRKQKEALERLAEEKRRQEEEEERRTEEKVRREEEKRILMKRQEEEEQIRREEEERERLAEEKRRQEEQERLAEEKRRQEEEERKLIEEEKVRQEEEKRILMKRQEEEEQIRREEQERERLAEEKRRQEEQQRERIEERERQQREEEMIRMEKERVQEDRRRQEEESMLAEEKRRREKERLIEEEKVRKEEEWRRKEEQMRRQEEEERSRKEEDRRREEEERARKEKEEYERLAEERRKLEQKERVRLEAEGRIKRQEQERMRKEEERHREEEEAERVRKEDEEQERRIFEEEQKRQREEDERIRKEEEDRAKKEREEYEKLVEEKKKLEEQETRQKEEEEEKIRIEERRRRAEDEEQTKKEEMERLAEEKRRLEKQDKRRIEEEGKHQRGEEERKRRAEAAGGEKRKEEARKMETEKLTDAEDQKKKETKAKDGPKAAGKKSTVAEEGPAGVPSTNPFDSPDTSTSQVSKVKHGYPSAVSPVGSEARSPDQKDLIGAQRDKRPAPRPPRGDAAEIQRERDVPKPHQAQMNKQSNDVKTASVLPRRSVQVIAPLNKSCTDATNSPSSMQSSASKAAAGGVAKHGKRPAPSRPSEQEELSSKPKGLSSSRGGGPETKPAPVVYGSNPFEDDEDEPAAQEHTPTPGAVRWPPPASQDEVKLKSSKVARAPPPPAQAVPASSTSALHVAEPAGGAAPAKAAKQARAPQPEVATSASVQDGSHKEAARAQSAAGGTGVRKEGPPATPRRLQPVKPLNPQEQKSAPVVPPEKSNDSADVLGEVQDETKIVPQVNDSVPKGPYSQLTREELVALVLKQEKQLSERGKTISELELYIDNLLVRVIEENPSILMSLNSLKRAV